MVIVILNNKMGNKQKRMVLVEKEAKPVKNKEEEETRVRFRPVPVEHEPKRNNLFTVEFPDEFGIESFLVKKINRPKLVLLNDRYEWENFNIEFYDTIGLSMSKSMIKLIQFCADKKSILNNNRPLFNFSIKSLDPTGVEIEEWVIEVEDLLKVDFGDCDYSDDGLQIVSIVLKPFDCILKY